MNAAWRDAYDMYSQLLFKQAHIPFNDKSFGYLALFENFVVETNLSFSAGGFQLR